MCGLTLYISKNVEDDRLLNNTSHRGPDHTIIHKFKYKDYFIRNLHDALSGHHSSSVAEAITFRCDYVNNCQEDFIISYHLF